MGLVDILVILLVVLIVVTRFTKFKLPKDPRDSAARRADYDRLKNRPLVRDEAPQMQGQMVDVTPQAKPASRKPSFKDLQESAKGLSGMAKLKVLEPGFDEAVFLEGTKDAYGYFYECWNARDEDGLDNLCAPQLYGRLITELQDDDAWKPLTVDQIAGIRVAEVRVHGKTAIIDVDFEVVEREDGGVAKTVKRRWVLAKPIGSEDPNWELQDVIAS